MLMETIYTAAGLLLVLTWVVYPILLSCLRIGRSASPVEREQRNAGDNSDSNAVRPRVTVLVAAWNAEKEIAERVRNLASQTWPKELLRIFIASDGSSDATVEVAQYAVPEAAAGFVYAKQFPRGGKSATQNLAMLEVANKDVTNKDVTSQEVSNEIVVLSDADTDFAPDCIEQLVRPFSDPSVGCVTGTMISRDASRTLSKDQGLYWRFENWLRLCESDSGILVTAAGACMAFRRELFVPLPPSRGDDCMIPLDVALKGYRVVHAPLAMAYDFFPSTLRGELKARKRMTARNLGGIFDRRELLNPFRYPGYALSLWLHKIFRWLTPFFGMALFVTSMSLAFRHPVVLTLQLMFFLLAGLGGLFALRGKPAPRLAAAAFSFLVANVGFALGTARWLLGKDITTYANIRDTVAPKPIQSA
jgi:cellulose synthase/poly-beta-1,6-N-acetylglucosamine synthase-like glycosyltransferase